MSIKLYFIALAVFLALDMIWLGFVANSFYASNLGYLMKAEINWLAAALFYALFIIGLVVFVIAPALQKSSYRHAIVFGLLFGLVTYATYDLTNLATIKDWPLSVTIVDLAWGSSLAATVSLASYLIAKRLDIKA